MYLAVRTELSVPLVLPEPIVSDRFPSSEILRPRQKMAIFKILRLKAIRMLKRLSYVKCVLKPSDRITIACDKKQYWNEMEDQEVLCSAVGSEDKIPRADGIAGLGEQHQSVLACTYCIL